MLQIIFILVGIYGLVKRRIKISSKKEMVGTPVVILSVIYLIMAVVPLFMTDLNLIISIGVAAVITLLFILFAPTQPTTDVKDNKIL